MPVITRWYFWHGGCTYLWVRRKEPQEEFDAGLWLDAWRNELYKLGCAELGLGDSELVERVLDIPTSTR